MVSIAEELKHLRAEIPTEVCLVAVSKTKPIAAVMEAYEAGQRIFGENHAQEMQEKAETCPKDIQWHFIGHLQRNKVKYIAPHVHLIHSIDSVRLLEEVNKQAIKIGRIIPVLLQIKIAKEDSKYGLDLEEAKEILIANTLNPLAGIAFHGLMGMATNTEDTTVVKTEFSLLKSYYDSLSSISAGNIDWQHCSMGMSGDFQLAMECGSNMVRVGSRIFGARNYPA
ncbi:MAG: pyridoxal phosphate enzyme (YggS family) [Sphingobacteriales bacterium]|jgi:pyridoxal phosphate enzyme (YggS family)